VHIVRHMPVHDRGEGHRYGGHDHEARPYGGIGRGMKAWLWERYGGPETLRLGDVPTPEPGAGDVLVRVHAVSVNAADWHSMRGKPLFSRLTLGLLRPKRHILGVDVAGQVEAIGRDVTTVKPGDAVFANLLDHGYGAFAEYVCAPATATSPKPAELSFTDAAAIPMAGATARQGLLHHGPIAPGRKVLINGGSGGVGSFAVQIARSYTPDVTVVTSPGNVDLVRSLGAARAIDYTATDFVQAGERYDYILDTVGNRSASDLKRALADGGKAAVTGFTSVSNLLGTSMRGGDAVKQVQAHVTATDLEHLSELATAGSVRPAIDRTHDFGEIPAAIAYVEQGHARGKVVATVP
jgi:NADPH:quinone reductase-like Zn-dependent oxidoreductase